MPACHAGDRRFDPGRDRHIFGSVAQSVEQRTENPRVGGSIPSRAIIKTTVITVVFIYLNPHITEDIYNLFQININEKMSRILQKNLLNLK